MGTVESSIIGFWRGGATMEEIVGITLLPVSEIENIIQTYKSKILQHDTTK